LISILDFLGDAAKEPPVGFVVHDNPTCQVSHDLTEEDLIEDRESDLHQLFHIGVVMATGHLHLKGLLGFL
jgi:hypothetical protein